MKSPFRRLYRQLTPILFFPLVATAVTGVIYGLCDRFFTLPTTVANFLIAIHKGQFLGVKLVPLYVLLMSVGILLICLVTLIDDQSSLVARQNLSNKLGVFYRPLILTLLIPLALCVETGVAYQLGKDWFGMSDEKTNAFLTIHGGSFLGTLWGLAYIVLAGLSLMILAVIGYQRATASVSQRMQSQEISSPQPESHSAKSHSSEIPASFVGNEDNFSFNDITGIKRKIQLGIIIFSAILIGILYFATDKLVASMAIIAIIFLLPAWLITAKLIQIWQHQKEIQARLYEREAESITILKAIPDSMLLLSQDGTCLSYMPAKEAKLFVLEGDIVNKNISEFLAPEIAQKFLTLAQLSLKKGSTRLHRFPISLNGIQQYHEARISPIGQSEVLIMVREIANLDDVSLASEPIISANNEEQISIQLLSETELIEILGTILEDTQQREQNHILFCLAIEPTKINPNKLLQIGDDLIYQIVTQVTSYLEFNAIARLKEDELVILVKDCSLDQTSELVDDLHRSLNEFTSNKQNGMSPIKFNISLLEVNADSPDALSLINVAKVTCEMAKQKVNLKTFW